MIVPIYLRRTGRTHGALCELLSSKANKLIYVMPTQPMMRGIGEIVEQILQSALGQLGANVGTPMSQYSRSKESIKLPGGRVLHLMCWDEFLRSPREVHDSAIMLDHTCCEQVLKGRL